MGERPMTLNEVARQYRHVGSRGLTEQMIRQALESAGFSAIDTKERERLLLLVDEAVRQEHADEIASLDRWIVEARDELGPDVDNEEILELARELRDSHESSDVERD